MEYNKSSGRVLKKAAWAIALLFILMNIVAANHAYKFTHFCDGGTRTERLNLSFANKVKLLFTGVDNPRPFNTARPSHLYKTVVLQSNVPIECWYIPTGETAKGTVLLFHGYTSNRSELLDRAEVFLQAGYNCLLTDFMGSGGSGGSQTTIGYFEAEEVKDCFNYIKGNGEQHVYLYGSSMGAVAIMKAIKDYQLQPERTIIECPFGTMYQTVCARFDMLHVPRFPMAGILLFWGSVENRFWGFSHNPEEYARHIKCPVLLQYGAHDDRVSRPETDAIFNNLAGPKKLIVYPDAGHDNYLLKCKDEWSNNVTAFLDHGI